MDDGKPTIFPSFATDRISVRFTRRGKAVISRRDRPDLPHLTLDWRNRSQTLDVHFTWEREFVQTPKGPRKRRETVFEIPLAKLEAMGPKLKRLMERHFLARFFPLYHKYRPGWLARKGYYVLLHSEDEMHAWFRTLAKKRKRRHEIDLKRALDPKQYPPEWFNDIPSADVLRLIDPKTLVAPLSLIRVVNGNIQAGHDITLGYMTGPGGIAGWWGFRQSKSTGAAEHFSRTIDNLIRKNARPEHREGLEKLIRHLGLEDFPEFAKAIEHYRELLPSR